MTAAAHAAHLAAFAQQVQALRDSATEAAPAARRLREQGDALCAALPPRFAEVLHDLLARLESSALFSEESCSFSRAGLVDNLALWAAKAGERLAVAQVAS